MSVASHKERGSALCPVLTFVTLVSFCGQHYSFRCCLQVTGFLATKRHKIHKRNKGISRESSTAINAAQHPDTKRFMEFAARDSSRPAQILNVSSMEKQSIECVQSQA